MASLAVLKERRAGERRVALVPSVVDKLAKLGLQVRLEAGAGAAIKLPDAAYRNVQVQSGYAALLADVDVVLGVQPPPLAAVRAMKPSAILVCFVYGHKEPALVQALCDQRVTCFAMDLLPRTSRAQAMDALSSQAVLAGYYAVLLGATKLDRILPMMTTAAGALRPATVLVMGLGVAGLQAAATAHRLGAVVEAYDIRPETAEEAASVGARFIDTGVDASGEGGYARELTSEEQGQVAQALTRHIQAADLVVTTAAVPGRPSPRLISREQVAGMKPGSVVVDLAAEGGGNCACTRPDQVVEVGQVTVLGPLNVPSLLGEHASELYAKNVCNLLQLIVRNGEVQPDWDDEIVAKAALTRDGEIVNAAVRQTLNPSRLRVTHEPVAAGPGGLPNV
ncbi:MAG: NAD(P) transhydrogenase subunit alpha [Chloroflexi bacterium]|nr:NAD(P) transhydrogenase subunit alpha [Chloroflexota bacterium]